MSTRQATPLAVELTADGPAVSHEPPTRPAAPDVVMVEPALVGVCRSDLKEIGGRRPGPSQFGHELVGVVTRSSTRRLPEGSRVCLDPNVPLRRGTGFARRMWAGGDARSLARALPLAPEGVPDRRLVFAEPLACAAHCLTMTRRHRETPSLRGVRMCVVGAGTAGVLIARLAEAYGALAAVTNRDAGRLEFLSSRRMLPGGGGAPPVKTPRKAWDVVVIATSFVLPELLEYALHLVRPGGLVMLYGGTKKGDHLPGLACDLDGVRRTERVETAGWSGVPVRIGGSYGTTEEDFAQALSALSDAPDGLGVERLITDEVSLADLPETLRRMSTSRWYGKVVMRP